MFQQNVGAEEQGKKSYLKVKVVSKYNYCTNIDCPTTHQVKLRLANTLLNLKLHIRIASVQKNNPYLLEEEMAKGCKTQMLGGFTWLPELKPGSLNKWTKKEKLCLLDFPHHSQNSN